MPINRVPAMKKPSPPPPPPEDSLPPVLRALLDAELAAGNTIIEVGHTHPAPPVGAYFKLARPVSTRPRESGGGLQFYERNSSQYSGEFTDAKRFFWILEAPLPPPPEPDMDAIRTAMDRAARDSAARPLLEAVPVLPRDPVKDPPHSTLVERFRRSMHLDFEAWKEGTGYEVTLIDEASPTELLELEQLVLNHSPRNWRDVQALVFLDSPRTRPALLSLLEHPNPEVRAAVLRFAPTLVDQPTRLRVLIRNIQSAEPFLGLDETFDLIAAFHPPEITRELLIACRTRSGDVACLLGALLLYIHGKADSPLAMEHRPFWLQLNTDDDAQRRRVLTELCERIGVTMPPIPRRTRGAKSR